MNRHANPRPGVCPRCDDASQENAFVQDIGSDPLFAIMNESARGPFNRRALFCKKCLDWAKTEKYLRETNQGQPIKCNPVCRTPDFATLEEDLSQLSDYQVTLSSPTGLSSLNMRPTDLIVTNIIDTNRNSPMEADNIQLYEDISESDAIDDRTETERIIDSMSDAEKFINNVLTSADNFGSIQRRLGEPLDPLELIQRIEPLQGNEPPDRFPDEPIQHAEEPIIESSVQQRAVQRVLPRIPQRFQRVQNINSDSEDPLDDNVPGKYFDC